MTAAASVVDIAVNPGNLAQRYVLWSNGRVDAVGGAPAITSGPSWYDRHDHPVGVALWITNWATGAGYILDYTGKFNSINGAPVLGTGGYVSGVPQSNVRKYVDWVWDPAGSGKGYVVDHWGQLYAFGGATAPTRIGPRWGHPACRRIKAQWTPTLKIIILDIYGGLWADFAAVVGGTGTGVLLWPGWDAARDFEIIDWTTGKGYILDLYGGHTPFGGAIVINGFPFKNGVDCGRRHFCLDPTLLIFWVIWDGGILIEFTNALPPTVVAGGGTNEVQKVTITGTPTGGTFTLSFGGNTTSALAFNASASTVQTALTGLASIGSGNATVTGGPGPGTPWTVTFTGTKSFTNVAQMTSSSSLTGGTSPTVAVSTLTDGLPGVPATTTTSTTRPTLAWTYSDPFLLSQSKWQLYVFTQSFANAHNMTDPSLSAASAVISASGTQPSQRGIVGSVDLANNTYVMFLRAQNYVGLWSAWASYTWTQNVSPPPAPTGLTATASNTAFNVTLSCFCTTGLADTVTFQYSDDGSTWNEVRGAETVPIATSLTVHDYDIPLGITRQYRAFTYKASPRFISAVTATVSASVTNLKYVLTATSNAALGGEVFVKDAPEWARKSDSGVFTGVEAEYPVVVSDGVPKARRQTITVETDSATQWAMVKGLVEADDTLLFRDPFGDVMYCRLVGDVTRTQQFKRPYPTEVTPRRHNHLTKLPLQEIVAPLLLDVGYTIPPGPVVPTLT